MRCQGKTVLITGASSGIGLACAQYFAAAGANLILCARRQQKLIELAQSLQETGVSVHTLCMDVTDYQSVCQCIADLPKQWQAVDILVNNAGLALGLDKIADGAVEDWQAMINTNISGVLYVTQQILPTMLARQRGHIINLGSLAGYQVYPGGTVYCATKFALRALSQGLKMDCHGTPIRVTSVNPGMVETGFSAVRFKGDQQKIDKAYAGMTPLTANDIADIVLYCASCPPHVNISEVLVMPTDQSSSTLCYRRQE